MVKMPKNGFFRINFPKFTQIFSLFCFLAFLSPFFPNACAKEKASTEADRKADKLRKCEIIYEDCGRCSTNPCREDCERDYKKCVERAGGKVEKQSDMLKKEK